MDEHHTTTQLSPEASRALHIIYHNALYGDSGTSGVGLLHGIGHRRMCAHTHIDMHVSLETSALRCVAMMMMMTVVVMSICYPLVCFAWLLLHSKQCVCLMFSCATSKNPLHTRKARRTGPEAMMMMMMMMMIVLGAGLRARPCVSACLLMAALPMESTERGRRRR